MFYTGWTLFVLVALWGLWRRTGGPMTRTSWSVGGGAAMEATPLELLANWFSLADLNLHWVYPWILFAPYVAWLGWRFPWGRRQWRTRLLAHLAGCALFAISTHMVWVSADSWHTVHVKFYIRTSGGSKRTQGAKRNSDQHNEPAAVPKETWVTNELAKQPPGVALSDDGPDQGKEWITDGRTTRLDPRVFGGSPARRGLSQDLLDLLSVFLYATLVGVVHTVQLHHRSKERERRAAALEAQLTAARLSALQAQLHPHFLFNALNAISTLLVRDARAARDTLASVSELLRLALCQSTQSELTLREDLEFLRRYVEIQQTRLGDRLRFEEVIPLETLDCLVPALLLQPLVENAIRHGVETSMKPVLVRVVVQARAKCLSVIVEDNGAGLSMEQREDHEGTGIGLNNLKARLETLYGPEHRLEFGPRPEGGVTVRVEFPLRRTRVPQPAAVLQ